MKQYSDGHTQTPDERQRDWEQLARTLAQLDEQGRYAAAYDHAHDGCPLDPWHDDDPSVECPVCKEHGVENSIVWDGLDA